MKPDNILCGGSHVDIKLADFGFANVLGTRTGFKSSVGTPVFMAPEIGDAMGSGGYSCAVDVWSAVSIPTMLVGLVRIANLVSSSHYVCAPREYCCGSCSLAFSRSTEVHLTK